jgi:hypothetical protein
MSQKVVKTVTTVRQPKVGKKNKTKKKQQGSSMSVGQRTATAPVSKYREFRSYFNTQKTRADGSLLTNGQEYLGQIAADPMGAGQLLFQAPIGPFTTAFSQGRLANFALNYEKYVFTKLKFHVQSGTSSTHAGSYIISFDRDVSDPLPPNGEGSIRMLMANQHSRTAAIWESQSITIPLEDTQKFYYTNYTGDDPRLAYQGRLLVYTQTPLISACNMSVWVEYEICFMDPALGQNDMAQEIPIKNSSFPTLEKNKGVALADPAYATTVIGDVLDKVATGFGTSQLFDRINGDFGYKIPAGDYEVELNTRMTPSSTTTTSPNNMSHVIYGQSTISSTPLTVKANPRSAVVQNAAIDFGSNFARIISTTLTGAVSHFLTSSFVLSVPSGGGIIAPYLANQPGSVNGLNLLQGAFMIIRRITSKQAGILLTE